MKKIILTVCTILLFSTMSFGSTIHSKIKAVIAHPESMPSTAAQHELSGYYAIVLKDITFQNGSGDIVDLSYYGLGTKEKMLMSKDKQILATCLTAMNADKKVSFYFQDEWKEHGYHIIQKIIVINN